jgi:hypothetical protein
MHYINQNLRLIVMVNHEISLSPTKRAGMQRENKAREVTKPIHIDKNTLSETNNMCLAAGRGYGVSTG